ncbi:CPBP family intramembrane metalloprotease [Bacillus methanolicus]|uniref:CPBP family intramembrane glutamic endopeptidase n=1 Tax=Bacillus methanolicus TaxID=1471 RepID=UPI00237FFA73|nr:type II CAAX endopeptidase family protein [Bacillus methanolicus]MDE3839435.1 CPBP family intramembrane metalloprotease [Bacillus methanolicus]
MKNKYKELISVLDSKELLFHLYATQILLLTISVILGMILFDSFSAFFELFHFTDFKILLVGGTAGLMIVFIDLLLIKLLPSSYYDDGGLNERIFAGKSIPHIAWLAACIAISEELLFRGMIQTHFGLIVSSVIFALVHYRYLFNWFLFLNITLLSFFIGFIYEWTDNLLVTIFMHFLIDFLLGVWIMVKKKQNEQEGIFHE